MSIFACVYCGFVTFDWIKLEDHYDRKHNHS